MPTERQEITSRGDAGWRAYGSMEEFQVVDAKVVPKRVEIHVGELRIVSDDSIGGVAIFIDGKEMTDSQDATLHLPLNGVPVLDIRLVLGRSNKKE